MQLATRGRPTVRPPRGGGVLVVRVVVVAGRVAAHAGGGAARALGAAARALRTADAEVRSVVGGEQAAAAGLAGDGGERIERVHRGILHAGAGASIGVADQHATVTVDRHVVEVEKVAALVAAAAVPDAAALHGVCGCRIGRRPGAPAVVGGGDVEVPDAGEGCRLRVARRGGAEEGESGPVVVPRHDLRELGVLDAERDASVLRLAPGGAAILRDGDLRVAVGVRVAEVHGVARADAHRWISTGRGGVAVRHRLDRPAHAVVGGDGDADAAGELRVLAVVVGDVGGAVGGDLDVPVQAAALPDGERRIGGAGKCIERDPGAEGHAAVVAARAERRP